ncbi:transposase, partial [Niallia sp. HCP3S3_B10]
HIAMSDERIVTAAVITSGEQGDGKYLKELVEKTNEAGMKVETILGDTAYSAKENLEYTKENNMQLVSKLHPVITNGQPHRKTGFEFNKDADMYACPAGHLAIKKGKKKREKDENRNPQLKYFFDVEKCKVCPFKNGCYKEGAKTKSFSVTIKSNTHLEQEAFQKTEEFKKMAKERYKIEAKNNELKNRHGLKKATSSGLFGMQIQGATTIFAVNLKRILKLMNEK